MNTIHYITLFVAIFAVGILAGYLLKVVIDNHNTNKNDSSDAMRITKNYWLILPLVILFIIIPVIINCIMLTPTSFNVYNGDWLSFWGAYLGAIASFVILFITIINNKSENEKNRVAQSNYIKCQVDYSRLDNLNASFSNYICALSQIELTFIAYQAKYDPIVSRNKVESILKHANESFQRVYSSIALYNNERGKSINKDLYNFQDAYNSVLADICFIINSLYPGRPNEDLGSVIEQNPSKNIKIIQAIKKGGYNPKNNQAEIMYDLVIGLNIDHVEKEMQDFVICEKQNIDRQMKAVQNSWI